MVCYIFLYYIANGVIVKLKKQRERFFMAKRREPEEHYIYVCPLCKRQVWLPASLPSAKKGETCCEIPMEFMIRQIWAFHKTDKK